MRRLFYKGLLADTIKITGSDAHHLMHVMRAKAGQLVTVVDDNGQVAAMEMVAFSDSAVTLQLKEHLAADTESPLKIMLAQCLLKADKMDMVVHHPASLGSVGVFAISSQNCVARYDAKKGAARKDRWQKIADEAAKQCGRTALLKVRPIVTLGQFIADMQATDSSLVFFYENENEQSAKAYLRSLKAKQIVLLVGPEGGFSLDEAKLIEEAGGKSVTLGPRILRAETAALTAIAVTQYENGDLGA